MMMVENNARYDHGGSNDNDDDDDMLESLMGTWTFMKTMTASHYYQIKTFFVIHFMADPLRQIGCQLDGCNELQNQICQEGDTCVNTESNTVEWSDVSMLMQFGWEVSTGYVWESTVAQNTSDWLGPYNILMAKQKQKEPKDNSTTTSYTSRYVETAGTSYMQYPIDCSIVSQKLFDPYAGLTAVQAMISKQMNLHDDNIDYDPYKNYTCPSATNQNKNSNYYQGGEVRWSPLLPRIEIFAPQKKKQDDTKKEMNLRLNFDLFAFPESSKTDPLYKVWPKLLKYLDATDIHGPYCWDHQNDDEGGVDVDLSYVDLKSKTGTIRKKKKDDGFHGYALPLVFDTRFSNNTWTIHKGCVDGLPCWNKGGNRTIPSDNGDDNKTPEWERFLLTYGVYFLIVAFLISLICNCQLCMKLKRIRRRQQQQRDPPNNGNGRNAVVSLSSRVDADTAPTTEEALREPLLADASPPPQEPNQEIAAPASAT